MKHFVLTSAVVTLFACLSVNPVNAQPTGTNNTTISGGNNNSVGSLAWANPNDIAATDGTYATVSALVSLLNILVTTTQYLTVTNLGFNIPTTSTIYGVTVTVNRQTFAILSIGGSYTTDNSIRLINSSGALDGTDHAATTTQWPTTLAPATYGANNDLWGTTLTAADINSPNFGVAISATLTAQIASIIFNAQIDQVLVTVYAAPTSMPLHIETFTAVATKGGNQLNWKAFADEAGDRFSIQRSADQSSWSNLTKMDASRGDQTYSYLDPFPLLNNNYYRLEQLNADGSIAYSQIVLVDGASPTSFRTYPNPCTDIINIAGPKPFSKIVLRDLQSKIVSIKEYTGGTNSAQISTAGLANGVYILQVDGANFKFIKN